MTKPRTTTVWAEFSCVECDFKMLIPLPPKRQEVDMWECPVCDALFALMYHGYGREVSDELVVPTPEEYEKARPIAYRDAEIKRAGRRARREASRDAATERKTA
jgi:hypothetical protein